ncbi:MAG: DJ-1/PfpI family protein [Lachnospiraceae bacterium]|nr:DJ-1/PfpI family protein [Lachnospiraceae bacterium]
MMKVFAFFAEGYEEIEGLTVIDILRRADIEVDMISVTDELSVAGAHGIVVNMDKTVGEVNFAEGDMIFLPGGIPGTPNLEKCEVLIKNILEYNKTGKKLAAICAAPSIYGHLGILEGKKATCYPGFEDELKGAVTVNDKVVTDGNITTSRGMGTSIDLGLEIVKIFKGEGLATELGRKIQYYI